MTTIDEHEKQLETAEKRANKAELLVEKLKHERYVTGQVRGFTDFLREQSVVGLAIGIILGTQAKDLVDQFTTSFINPITYLLLPGKGSLSDKTAYIRFDGKATPFAWGAFVIGLFTFVIVLAIIYYTFRALRLDKLQKKQ